jgi:hypothetical protein
VPVTGPAFARRLAENTNDLAELVRVQLAVWGHPPEGPELDDGGATYAAVCTAARGARLAALLHARYAAEVARDEVCVTLAPWGPRFPDLATPELAERFLARGRRAARPHEADL